MLNYVSEHRAEYVTDLRQHHAAVRRGDPARAAALEQQGGDLFFGEPPLGIYDWGCAPTPD